MLLPIICPICRCEAVERFMGDTLLSAHLDGVTCPSSGVVAYHCHAGHVFLIAGEGFQWKEAVPNGSTYSRGL